MGQKPERDFRHSGYHHYKIVLGQRNTYSWMRDQSGQGGGEQYRPQRALLRCRDGADDNARLLSGVRHLRGGRAVAGRDVHVLRGVLRRRSVVVRVLARGRPRVPAHALAVISAAAAAPVAAVSRRPATASRRILAGAHATAPRVGMFLVSWLEGTTLL